MWIFHTAHLGALCISIKPCFLKLIISVFNLYEPDPKLFEAMGIFPLTLDQALNVVSVTFTNAAFIEIS